MADREKVIKAMENCAAKPKCKECPWDTCEVIDHATVTIPLDLATGVLELLKAQEPRVLTFDEAVEAHECWFESINGAYGYCDIYPFNENIVEIYRLRNHTEGIDIDGYGKIWRCWSSRPTDEQRKETAWRES